MVWFDEHNTMYPNPVAPMELSIGGKAWSNQFGSVPRSENHFYPNISKGVCIDMVQELAAGLVR